MGNASSDKMEDDAGESSKPLFGRVEGHANEWWDKLLQITEVARILVDEEVVVEIEPFNCDENECMIKGKHTGVVIRSLTALDRYANHGVERALLSEIVDAATIHKSCIKICPGVKLNTGALIKHGGMKV